VGRSPQTGGGFKWWSEKRSQTQKPLLKYLRTPTYEDAKVTCVSAIAISLFVDACARKVGREARKCGCMVACTYVKGATR
jgi:hypothetical protein